MAWRSNKRSRTLEPPKQKIKRVQKVKIRWGVLGLTPPDSELPSMPIEEVRRQVSLLASRGFGHGTRSRSPMARARGADGGSRGGTVRPGRRGSKG